VLYSAKDLLSSQILSENAEIKITVYKLKFYPFFQLLCKIQSLKLKCATSLFCPLSLCGSETDILREDHQMVFLEKRALRIISVFKERKNYVLWYRNPLKNRYI
jgi:hypothetical protein